MEKLIKSFGFTKATSRLEIKETLLNVDDFSSDYYAIKSMNCSSYVEVGEKIYDYIKTL